MRAVPGGDYLLGSDDFYPDERPVRRVRVAPFRIDETPVTNAQFAAFVAATGHVTAAETAPDPADYPGMPPEMANAGSIVFVGSEARVPLGGAPTWWEFVFGASWRAPLGPGSDLTGLGDHPVVHVAAADAEAYARWAGKALPTEAEWEAAARGGLVGAPYAWGTEFAPGGRKMANVWEGDFPWRNAAPPERQRTSAVGSHPANGYGLFDMIGNVWEWTADWHRSERRDHGPACCGGDAAARAASGDPHAPHIPRRVTKGGSHLCAPEYCLRYRPAARWPQAVDTSTSHLGFRCVVRDTDSSLRA